MAASAEAPLPAFVNGPFFSLIDRRGLVEDVPLNELLLNNVAELCADVLAGAVDG